MWQMIPKTDFLVVGSPIRRMDESGPILEVQLVTGQKIVHGSQGFSIL